MQVLFKLMDGYGYEKISVTDIVKKAGVGRSTFYRYFKSKEDVIVYDTDQIRRPENICRSSMAEFICRGMAQDPVMGTLVCINSKATGNAEAHFEKSGYFSVRTGGICAICAVFSGAGRTMSY